MLLSRTLYVPTASTSLEKMLLHLKSIRLFVDKWEAVTWSSVMWVAAATWWRDVDLIEECRRTDIFSHIWSMRMRPGRQPSCSMWELQGSSEVFLSTDVDLKQKKQDCFDALISIKCVLIKNTCASAALGPFIYYVRTNFRISDPPTPCTHQLWRHYDNNT